MVGSVRREFIIISNSDWSSRYFIIPYSWKRADIFKYSNYESAAALVVVIPKMVKRMLFLIETT
jgi:hypothetical protein